MKRALVIGGSGFLGSHLLKAMVNEGYEILAVQHRSPVITDKSVRIIPGGIDVVDSRLIRDARPDLIFHFGRPRLPRLRVLGRSLAGRYAALKNQRLVGELERSGQPCRLIFASGSLMYGASDQPVDEGLPLKPSSFARHYRRGESPILEAMASGRISVNVIRFPWLLGAGSWFDWFYLRTMMTGHAVPLFGKGDNLMDIIDIEDAAGLTLHCTREFHAPGVLNMVTAGPVSQLEFAGAVSKVFGLPVRDYREIFPGRPEKAALEAFSSTIILATRYPGLARGYRYHTLDDTLQGIREANGKI